MLRSMDSVGLFLIFPIGLMGLAYLTIHDLKRALFLGLWALPGLFLYASYYWADEGPGKWYIRFFLSIFPPFLLSALAFLDASVPSRRGWWKLAVGCFVLLVAGINLSETIRKLEQQSVELRSVRFLMETASRVWPSNAVIFSENRILNFVEYMGDFRLYSYDLFSRTSIRKRTQFLEDANPHPFQRERAETLRRLLGNQNSAQLVEIQCKRISQWISEGQTVAMICRKEHLPKWRERFENSFRIIPLTECTEVRASSKGSLRTTIWSFISIQPRLAHSLISLIP